MIKKKLKRIKSIELDLSIFGEAKILIRDENNYIIDTVQPRWSEKYNVYEKIVHRWFEGIKDP